MTNVAVYVQHIFETESEVPVGLHSRKFRLDTQPIVLYRSMMALMISYSQRFRSKIQTDHILHCHSLVTVGKCSLADWLNTAVLLADEWYSIGILSNAWANPNHGSIQVNVKAVHSPKSFGGVEICTAHSRRVD